MNAYRHQIEALEAASTLIQKLPDGVVWALEVTNDDDASSPSVLNIFADEDEWLGMIETLRLGIPIDRSTHIGEPLFLSFKQGTLLISFIQEAS